MFFSSVSTNLPFSFPLCNEGGQDPQQMQLLLMDFQPPEQLAAIKLSFLSTIHSQVFRYVMATHNGLRWRMSDSSHSGSLDEGNTPAVTRELQSVTSPSLHPCWHVPSLLRMSLSGNHGSRVTAVTVLWVLSLRQTLQEECQKSLHTELAPLPKS